MTLYYQLSDLILHERGEMGLTLEELSARSGCAITTISGIESGRHSTSLQKAEKILLALGYELRAVKREK